ncbi:aspartic peptidase domain-containing protein [Mycena sp. CBHHK59/15]|nr:aspartic peptidase domain-containing protein [Mycena sp. CBHHK59/15]
MRLAVLSILSLFGAIHAKPNVARQVSLAPRSLEAVSIPKADFAFPFTKKAPRGKARKNAPGASLRGNKSRGNTASVAGTEFDQVYLTNITVGGQNFSVIVDSGSSDTWIIQKGYSCFNLSGSPVSADTCAFGTTGFDPSESEMFELLPNASCYIRYGSGVYLLGPAGFETVTIGGMTVTHQEIGVPTDAAFLGDGFSSGVLGLAFPRLTNIYNSTTVHSSATHVPYTPLFLSAVQQNQVENPFFSIAVNRGTFEEQVNDHFDANLGFVAFGGIAPVPVLKTAVTVPVQGYVFSGGRAVPANSTDTDPIYLWYTVHVDSYVFPGSSQVVTASNNTFFDTGSTMNWVPTDVAAAYAAQFQPPATLDEDSGMYLVDCNATVPPFSVILGGKEFTIDARDQILPSGNAITCFTGTQDGGLAVTGNALTLGDVFLHNVVATFNPVAAEITITKRAAY